MNNVALITGAASGLGGATAAHLASHGWTIVGVDLNEEKGEAHFATLEGEGHRFVVADVTDEAAMQGASDIATSLGSLRASIACAGVAWASRMVKRDGSAHPLDLFSKVIQINLIGTFNVARLASAAMCNNEPDEHGQRGVLIHTASVAAFEGQIGQVAYSASKGGVAGMCLPIARDLASRGVRCLTIAPGIFMTPMVAGMPEKVQESLAASIPNPSRLGKAEEYAKLAKFMIETPYLNGETIRLDGAVRLAPR